MTQTIFNHSKVYNINNAVSYADGSIVSKIISRNQAGNVTLFAFDKGQMLSEHTAPYDAMLQILEGEAVVVINGNSFKLSAGNMIIMPANSPHALNADEKFKMLLVMIKG